LEDPRLSRMYFAIVMQNFARLRRHFWHTVLMESGLLSVIALMMMLMLGAIGWREHRKGNFAKLKTELKLKPVPHEQPVVLRPGGQDPVVLERAQIAGGAEPEFLSATLLPGRGMNVLQISAFLPQLGDVQLLASPSLAAATHLLNDPAAVSTGSGLLPVGGAIEAPWAGRITGVKSADGDSITAIWHGRRLTLPTDPQNRVDGMAAGGLLLMRPSDSVSTNTMPDGEEANATFRAGDFNGHWVSQTEVTTAVQLSSRAIEIKVVAHNTGSEPEPIGIGWRPRFAILSGNRGQEALRLPAGLRTEISDRRTGLPTGKLLPVEGTAYDFTKRDGKPLGEMNLDDSFVHLKPGLLDNGPAVELRDLQSGYGLRVTAMTSAIKAIRIYAPVNEKFVSIEPQFNFDDPFGREWARDEDTGMVVLQPGRTVQWEIRLEIFPLSSDLPEHLEAKMGWRRTGAGFDPPQRRLVQ
jgi:aldose 1-epimerase